GRPPLHKYFLSKAKRAPAQQRGCSGDMQLRGMARPRPHGLFDNQSAAEANRQHTARVIGRYVAYGDIGYDQAAFCQLCELDWFHHRLARAIANPEVCRAHLLRPQCYAVKVVRKATSIASA